ncbi:MAG TPA: amidohydrolase family protein [Candidatus Binatia bacterium]
MIIDMHAHFIPTEWIDALRKNGQACGCKIEQDSAGHLQISITGESKPLRLSPSLSDVPRRMRALNERRLDRQVLAPVMSMVGYRLPQRQAQGFSRLYNETNATFAETSNGRFIPVATVPMQFSQTAVEELDYAVNSLGIRMVEIGTNINGQNLDEESFRPFFARAAELGVLVQLHPHQDQVAGKDRLGKYFLSNLIGNPMDTAIAAASLIFGGLLERYPTLNVCLVHGGGALPYLLGRISCGYSQIPEIRTMPRVPEEYFQRFYFDTMTHDARGLTFLHGLAGAEHLMVGTDYPYDNTGDQDPIGLLERAGISGSKSILGGNAAKLLNL